MDWTHVKARQTQGFRSTTFIQADTSTVCSRASAARAPPARRAPVRRRPHYVTNSFPLVEASARFALSLLMGCTACGGRTQQAPPDSQPPSQWSMPAREVCPGAYADPAEVGPLADPALVETSGIIASPSNPGILWLHNDSGDGPVLYATGTDGASIGRVVVTGVDWPDLEDIAAAPCPHRSGPCLWAADTGNNTHDRTDLAVYALEEPRLAGRVPFGEMNAGRVWRFPIAYPDDTVDSEALAVESDASAFYLFEKVDAAKTRLFRASGPFTEDQPVALEEIARFAAPGVAISKGTMITAADLHPSGQRLLLRVYTGVFEYRFGPGQGMADIAVAERVTVAFGPFDEPQGEAVAYDESGAGLFTVSEDREGRPGQPLHWYGCR